MPNCWEGQGATRARADVRVRDDLAVVTDDELVALCAEQRPDAVVLEVDTSAWEVPTLVTRVRDVVPRARLVGLYGEPRPGARRSASPGRPDIARAPDRRRRPLVRGPSAGGGERGVPPPEHACAGRSRPAGSSTDRAPGPSPPHQPRNCAGVAAHVGSSRREWERQRRRCVAPGVSLARRRPERGERRRTPCRNGCHHRRPLLACHGGAHRRGSTGT